MPEVIISEFMDETVVNDLSERFDVVYDPSLADRVDELAGLVEEAVILVVRNRTQVDEKLLTRATQLELVGRLGVGLDNIDTATCEARRIDIVSGAGLNTTGVAEYVVAMALLLRRRLPGSTEGVLAGSWPRRQHVGRELAGETMGLIGFGSVARSVAIRVEALRVRTTAHDPYLDTTDSDVWGSTKPGSLEEVLTTSDIISVHVPRTDETTALIGADEISRMQAGALLINTSRGGVVDEEAMITALRDGRLGGAALDVFEHEPLSAANAARFRDVPNLILTPHIAGVTEQSEERIARAIADAIASRLGDRA